MVVISGREVDVGPGLTTGVGVPDSDTRVREVVSRRDQDGVGGFFLWTHPLSPFYRVGLDSTRER